MAFPAWDIRKVWTSREWSLVMPDMSGWLRRICRITWMCFLLILANIKWNLWDIILVKWLLFTNIRLSNMDMLHQYREERRNWCLPFESKIRKVFFGVPSAIHRFFVFLPTNRTRAPLAALAVSLFRKMKKSYSGSKQYRRMKYSRTNAAWWMKAARWGRL